jgi:hypothetical protein
VSTLDELRAVRDGGQVAKATEYLGPQEAYTRGPFGGLVIYNVAEGYAVDMHNPAVRFKIGGEETWAEWSERVAGQA